MVSPDQRRHGLHVPPPGLRVAAGAWQDTTIHVVVTSSSREPELVPSTCLLLFTTCQPLDKVKYSLKIQVPMQSSRWKTICWSILHIPDYPSYVHRVKKSSIGSLE